MFGLLALGGLAISGISLFAGSQIDDYIDQGQPAGGGISLPGGNIVTKSLGSVALYGGLGYLAFIGVKQVMKKTK